MHVMNAHDDIHVQYDDDTHMMFITMCMLCMVVVCVRGLYVYEGVSACLCARVRVCVAYVF